MVFLINARNEKNLLSLSRVSGDKIKKATAQLQRNEEKFFFTLVNLNDPDMITRKTITTPIQKFITSVSSNDSPDQ